MMINKMDDLTELQQRDLRLHSLKIMSDEDQDKSPVRNHGLTTKEALLKLHSEMEQEIVRTKRDFAKRGFISWLVESISFKSELSKMRWPSVLFMAAQAIAHFIVAFILDVDNLAVNWVGFQGFILTTLLIFNLAVNLWDTKLRFKELLMKAEQTLDLIKQCSQDKHLLKSWTRYNWNAAQPKTLFIPKSPCAHQTLAYRDKSCLNLPDYLLVKGDIIHLYPGDRAPGECVSFGVINEPGGTAKEGDRIILKEGEIFHDDAIINLDKEQYNPSCMNDEKSDSKLSDKKSSIMQFSHARLKKAKKGSDFLMLSTPYIRSLQISLQRSHKRPVNSVEKECFIISRKYFETFVIPSVFILSTIVTAIHYGYLDLTDSDQKIKTISIAHLLMRPSLTIMPFLPWMFPCFWLVVNAYGSARILCCGEAHREKARQANVNHDNQGYSPGWTYRGMNSAATTSKFTTNLLATPTAAGSSENKQDEDDLHDLRNKIEFTTILKVFINLVKGNSGHVWRSSSLLQVLGSLTSLCCIDKVGILSWSNPSPEKVFILTKNQTNEWGHLIPNRNQSDDDVSHSEVGNANQQAIITNENSGLVGLDTNHNKMFHDDQISSNHVGAQSKPNIISTGVPEVLDVSQTLNCYRGSFIEPIVCQQQSRLQFDDLSWRKYISNLKPLGLTMLMNNCCEKSFGEYFRFYKHISYESMLRCNLAPVVKRRCLCGLSKLVGFSKDAIENYKFISQIGIYKLIDPNLIQRGKLLTPSDNTTRLKLPFPNMVCNIQQDVTTGGYQVFSQGTGDIVLDACVEYWDGKQLVPLDDLSRRKIMDFYHRTSLTSYCSAFSFTPLLNNHDLDGRYIEFPPENSKFSTHLRKLANQSQEEFLRNQMISLPTKSYETNQFYGSLLSSQDNIQSNSLNDTFNTTGQMVKETSQMTRRHLSTEDLNEPIKRTDYKDGRQKKNKRGKKKRKLNEALDELTDQVFIGMVAMQYQACPDFVALVEQLEHACIRFVHFSKENELRSRVFSEKMGLESGWNCHISLQSNQDLDLANKSMVDNLVSPVTKYKLKGNDSLRLNNFSPSSRVSSILTGNSMEKSLIGPVQRINNTDNVDSLSSDEHTLYSWKSLPSLVMQLTANLSNGRHHHHHHNHNYQQQSSVMPPDHNNEQADETVGFQNFSADFSGNENVLPDSDYNYDYPENNSCKDEGFESLAFDMSNRAKLPKGIENIRPHLETIDNVPLQVSLFTDCTPELTQEMIEIMQDYGEIVCVIGSSSSRMNTPLFLQANASIAIEPLLPQSCTRNDARAQRTLDRSRRKRYKKEKKAAGKFNQIQKAKNEELEVEFATINPRPSNPRDRLGIGPSEPTKTMRTKPQPLPSSSSTSSTSSSSSCSSSSNSECEFDDAILSDIDLLDTDDMGKSNDLLREFPGPNSLASRLASLPCSYSYNRKDPVNLYGLIMEARHFTFKMKNTFVCMICFALSISSGQFLASILFLPPMLSSGLTIWLTVVVVPLQSFSLMSTTIDSQVMKIAVGKNLQLKPENITFFVICYLIKFIPSIIVIVLSFGLIIAHSCKLTGFGSSSLGPCWMFTYVQHGNATSSDTGDEDLLWSTHLLTAQVCVAFLLVLYFVVISAGFVHRSHLMWQRSPTTNRFWVIISLALIFGQLFYNQLVLQFNLSSLKIPLEFLASLPSHIWAISFTWPILVIGINLLVKRAEIKATVRQQRRARFDFNTKLGMNSPF